MIGLGDRRLSGGLHRGGGEAYFALATEWRFWRGLRSFPRRGPL
jgi:hypothetical protein